MPDFSAVDYQTSIDYGQGSYQSQIAYVQNTMLERGFALNQPLPLNRFNQPLNGQLPQNLTQHSDEQLGDLLNDLSRYKDFVEMELAKALMAYNTAKAVVDNIEAQLRLAYKLGPDGKKRTEQERDDCMRIDKRYVDAQAALLYYEGIYHLTKPIAKSADRNWETVSRRISQRQSEAERGRREVSVGNRSPVFGNVPAPNWPR